jgi:putative membrane protein
MPVISSDVKMERLTKYLFNAPSWPRSLLIIIVLGLVIDGASLRMGQDVKFLGTLGFTIPAFVAFVCTKPVIGLLGSGMTWNRSAMLAMSCTVFGIIISLSSLVFSFELLPLFYAISLGFISGIRLFILVAIADYRPSRMLPPALIHGFFGIFMGYFLFAASFVLLALVLQLVFVLGVLLLIWTIERPLYRAFGIRGLHLLNSFLEHLTDGSKGMEDFFREIGEEVYVPQVSLFFKREGKRGLTFTVPNVHPGPIGEIGGGNIPRCLQEHNADLVMAAHGTATHDFNLVSESEISKIISAMRRSEEKVIYSPMVSRSVRYRYGTVEVLYQVFHDTLLIVSTRSPEKTEDLEYGIGMTIMAEGHRSFPNIAFVDAHNAHTGDLTAIQPGTLTATEYLNACIYAIDSAPSLEKYPVLVGMSHVTVPFTREQGFGDQGIQAMVLEVAGQRTAYVLFDGNNMHEGVRETLRGRVLFYADDGEVMTTDSHVVNTISGKNPIGYHVPVEEIVPYIDKALEEARSDLSPSAVGGSTALCERVVVFGSDSIAQLASTVNTMILFIPPLGVAILLLAFLLSFMAYIVIG